MSADMASFPFAASLQKAAVYSALAQSLGAGAATKLNLDTVVFDSDSIAIPSLGRLRPRMPGFYIAYGLSGLTTSANHFCLLQKNGGTAAQGNDTTALGLSVQGLVYMNGTTDYLELSIFNRTGGSLTTANNSGINFLTILGPF